MWCVRRVYSDSESEWRQHSKNQSVSERPSVKDYRRRGSKYFRLFIGNGYTRETITPSTIQCSAYQHMKRRHSMHIESVRDSDDGTLVETTYFGDNVAVLGHCPL